MFKNVFTTSKHSFFAVSLNYDKEAFVVEKAFIDLLANNYNKVFNFTGSSVVAGDLSIALQYTLNGRIYNGLEHESVVKKIRIPMPLSSVMHGYGNDAILLDKIAAKFIIEGNVDDSVQKLHHNLELLKAQKFSNCYSLMYSALFLQDEAHAKRAKIFFDEMKGHQRFLTRKTDYPITLILTQQPHDPKQLADTMYRYYEALRNPLKAGDPLQMLAQFLTFYSPAYEPTLVDYTLSIWQQLKTKNIKVRRDSYPLLGLLALNATNQEKLHDVVALYHDILQHKTFKSYPEMALTAAVLKSLTAQYTEDAMTGEVPPSWLDIGLYSDIFAVIPKTLIEGVLSADFNIFN